jgi:hypothetical protein
MTPSHVHVASILRGARQNVEPTGNPTLDLQQERETRDHRRQYQPEDEFAGLMSQRDRQWIINIQVNQLKDEHDYYFTVYNQQKKAIEEGIDLKRGRRHFFGNFSLLKSISNVCTLCYF